MKNFPPDKDKEASMGYPILKEIFTWWSTKLFSSLFGHHFTQFIETWSQPESQKTLRVVFVKETFSVIL